MGKIKFKYENSFAIISILLIPVLTLLYGTKEPPKEYTLSMIGNRFDARLDFIIWGIVTALLLIFYVLHLFKLGAFNNKDARQLVIRSGIFLILTVLIPAIEELWPILHKLHAVCGALFGFSLIISIYYFIRYIKFFDKKLYSLSFYLLMIVVGGSISLLLIFGNSGIYEIFFFISISCVLLFLEIMVKKNRQKIIEKMKNFKKFLRPNKGKLN